jgi:competence protein ComEA
MLERLEPGAGGVRALVVVGLIAALVAAGYLWMARPRPVPEAADQPALTAGSSPAVPARQASGTGQGATVMVHVFGKVKRPGVVTLPGGSRVIDAINAAGGVRPGAGTGTLNLARKVLDGEQIPVGVRTPSGASPPNGTPGAAAGAPSPAGSAGDPLDLNTASVDQLDQLPGVGPVLAQRIVDYRSQHGAFRSVEQLQEVSGIGAQRFADLKSTVRV